MAFIDYDYYNNVFHGSPMPLTDFTRLADISTDLITLLIGYTPETVSDGVRLAAAYETELLYLRGGISALCGLDTAGELREQLGDWSVTRGAVSASVVTVCGVPVSPLTLFHLRREGYTCRVIASEGVV